MSKNQTKAPQNNINEFQDDLEKKIYQLLSDALVREECAARAAARVEFDIVQQHQQSQEPPTTDAEKVEEESDEIVASKDFSTGQFQNLFTNLNTLRTVAELAALLQVQNKVDEISSILILTMFGQKQSSSVGRHSGERTMIGTDLDVLLAHLRENAALRQRRG